MQLTDVLALAAQEGIRRRIEKRAGIMLPLAVGAMVPGIVHKAVERANSTEHEMNKAVNQPFKTAAPTGPFKAQSAWSPMGAQYRAPTPSNQGTPPGGMLAAMMGSLFKNKATGSVMDSVGDLAASPVSGVASGISGGIGESVKRKMLGREFGERKDPFHMGAGAAISSFGKEMGTSGANLLRDIANKAMEAAGHAGDASAREAIIGDLKRTDPVLAGADDATLMEAYHTMSRFAPVLSTDKNAVRSFLRQAVTSGSGPDFMSIKLVADAERAVTGDKQ